MIDGEEEEERQEVEYGADRSESDHEVPDEFYVPVFRFLDILLIDIIRRQRDLREIIEEVIEQYLARQHRQERQEHDGADHAEHVSEIGAQSHHKVFHSISERLPSFDDPIEKLFQSLPDENDISGLLSDIHCVIDGNADIGALERRCIVDTVA